MILYPSGFTCGIRIVLGLAVFLPNAAIYGFGLIREGRVGFRRRG